MSAKSCISYIIEIIIIGTYIITIFELIYFYCIFKIIVTFNTIMIGIISTYIACFTRDITFFIV